MIDLKYLVNISSRKKYALMIREAFLNSFKTKFNKINYNDLIILSINSLKKNLNKIIKNHLGEIGGSVDAEAYKICIKIKQNNYKYKLYSALKIIPLVSNESNKVMDLSYKSWKELYILKMIYNLIKNHNCPNIPIIYLYFICNNCNIDDYLNPNIIKYYNNLNIRQNLKNNISFENNKEILHKMCKKKGFGTSSLCILNELCDSSLKDIINNKYIENISDNMFYSFIFQIISSIYSVHKFINICHFDLHGGNFLISNIENNGFWLYTINNQDFYLPNYGYILKIWDFGRSMIIGTDPINDIINQIIHQAKRFFKDPFSKNPKLESTIQNKLDKNNIKIILLSFDIWRIISYLYSKFKKEKYYNLKFKKTIKLLNSIKTDTEKNWIHPLIFNNDINNSNETFINYLLNKYFSKYKNVKNNLINKKTYSI
tara:strand:+ start:449 stop:1735 length:1287 start_codon:yes stop_codon:yes gene_type:complete